MEHLGAAVDASRLIHTLEHVFSNNDKHAAAGGRATPICVWGLHGIGKTMIIEQFARTHGWGFSYCAPAQFEEMGDLNGMPMLTNDGRTAFAPPTWVPTEPGPGILLLDDINRADDRILRGLMQLLQDGQLISWKLPPRWQIVCTANPEGGDYSVTPMDDAMLTRMLHVTLEFDPVAWAKWAKENSIDSRGIDFVLSYPEVTAGRRTTPRSLTQFFLSIDDIEDLTANRQLVETLALSCLDESTAGAFMAFTEEGMVALPTVLEILEAKDINDVLSRLGRIVSPDGERTHVDRVAILCDRLVEHLTQKGYRAKKKHGENLVRFFLDGPIPTDLRVSLHRDLTARGSKGVKEMMRDARVAKVLLDGM